MKNIKLSEDLEGLMRYENSAFGKLSKKVLKEAKEGKVLDQVVEDTHSGGEYFDDIRATKGAYAQAFDSIEYKNDPKVKRKEKKYDFNKGKTRLKDLLTPSKSISDELKEDEKLKQYLSVKKEVAILDEGELDGDSNALIQGMELQDEEEDTLAMLKGKRAKRKAIKKFGKLKMKEEDNEEEATSKYVDALDSSEDYESEEEKDEECETCGCGEDEECDECKDQEEEEDGVLKKAFDKMMGLDKVKITHPLKEQVEESSAHYEQGLLMLEENKEPKALPTNDATYNNEKSVAQGYANHFSKYLK